MRLFFALWPPPAAAAALHAWALEAQRQTGGRVARAESIHLTLAFLGEVEEGLVSLLMDLPLTGKRHELPVEHAECWKHNSIVWVGPEKVPPELAAIAESLSGKLSKKGFKSEKRPYKAHISLIRKASRAAALPPLPAVVWPVEEIVLVRSQLSAAGSSYEVLQRYALRRR